MANTMVLNVLLLSCAMVTVFGECVKQHLAIARRSNRAGVMGCFEIGSVRRLADCHLIW
jgi:hypothetical protein